MSKIGKSENNGASEVPMCSLAKERKDGDFKPVDVLPGATMMILRENPTSAIMRFKGASIERTHHHTFGYDLVVMKGKKHVWNLTRGAKYDLGPGDYLFTPAGDVHRAKYDEDTEFFIKWDGPWDFLLDEDVDAAHAAVDKDN